MEQGRYDRGSKWLIERHGDAILRMGGLDNIEAWRAAASEVVQPRQTPDGLLEVRFTGETEFHPFVLEIETFPFSRTRRALLDDVMFVCQARGVLPDVMVLVLKPKGNVTVPDDWPLQSHHGWTTLHGSWRVVRLWEVPASDLLATGDPGVMPWVPLAHIDGPADTILQECRRIIDEKGRPEERANLLAVSQVLGGLQYNTTVLRAIFGGKEAMIESPVLQELIAEQNAETTRKNILGILKARFGPVPVEIGATLAGVTDEQRLDGLIARAATCPDLDAFRGHFRS